LRRRGKSGAQVKPVDRVEDGSGSRSSRIVSRSWSELARPAFVQPRIVLVQVGGPARRRRTGRRRLGVKCRRGAAVEGGGAIQRATVAQHRGRILTTSGVPVRAGGRLQIGERRGRMVLTEELGRVGIFDVVVDRVGSAVGRRRRRIAVVRRRHEPAGRLHIVVAARVRVAVSVGPLRAAVLVGHVVGEEGACAGVGVGVARGGH